MVLFQKACESILSEYEKEFSRNPDAAGDPYVQLLADKCGRIFDGIRRECEQRVVATLFLNLYGLDASALRRDLCNFDALPPASATPSRGRLLLALYGAIALYVEGDPSALTVPAHGPVTLVDQERCKNILSKFKQAACGHPKNDYIPQYTLSLMGAIAFGKTTEEKFERAVIDSLFEFLYGADVPSLRTDLVKCKVIYMDSAQPSQRPEMLQYLYGALSRYIDEDFSSIMELCDKVEALP